MALQPLDFGENGWLSGARRVPSPNNNGMGSLTLPMNGAVMHTMVGSHAENYFASPSAQVSAHFCVNEDGPIVQCVSIHALAWHCADGNNMWYGIEHADRGDPKRALTQRQMEQSAQILEALSHYASFPLQASRDIDDRGYACHYMGGAAWGGHSCPDYPTGGIGPRSGQRADILTIAQAICDIRNGKKPAPAPAPKPVDPGQEIRHGFYRHVANGTISLNAYARRRNTTADHIAAHTEAADSPISESNRERFVSYRLAKGAGKQAQASDAVMPAGLVFYTDNP